MIPFVDLKAQYRALKPELDAAIARVIENAVFIGGEEVTAFEAEFAQFSEASHAIAVSSGTAALELIFRALPLTAGDEVIVPANSYIATAFAPSLVGAVPVFVDCDPLTYNIDPAKIEAAITSRTKVIAVTHLYGQSADMDPIMEIAERRGLLVVEDACQSHGARYHGKRVGSFGIASAFSFYPGKNLGAYGDGGAIITNDADLAARLKRLREYGQTEKYVHLEKGTNARLDTLQAAILRVKLVHLENWNQARTHNAALYSSKLSVAGFTPPSIAPGNDHVFHIFAIEVDRRDDMLAYLKERGIQGNIHYPVPIHLQGAYREQGHVEGDFPVCEKAAKRILALPMFPELTEMQIDEVVAAVTAFPR